MTRRLALTLLLTGLAAGCARQPATVMSPPAAAAGVPAPKPGTGALQADLARLFRAPAFDHAIWGVQIQSLDTGETLFSLNPGTLLMPASNMKIVTLAAAAERLGWSHTFETTITSTAAVTDGVLAGDLVVVGSGDPSIGARGASTRVFEAWADALKAQGIAAIDGRIIGDDNALDDRGLGQGWAWDYLGYGYATPSGALEFNEDLVMLTIVPGASAGDPAAITARPAGNNLIIDNRLVTGVKDGEADFDYERLPGSQVLRVTGSVPAGHAEIVRGVSVDNPTAYFVSVLRAVLIARGIDVRGEAVDIDALPAPPDLSSARVLLTHTSPPLSDLGTVMLKVSQNLYADTLLKVLGRAGGVPGSAEAGRKVVQDVLQTWGIAPDRYVQIDGSGLSRYNYLAPDVLIAVLAHLYRDPRHRGPFTEALPIAGVDGTLAARMKGTRAENNARAKTGSIANARSLSGYVTTAEGEHLVFSIIANNFNVPPAEADVVADAAVARLAVFRRR